MEASSFADVIRAVQDDLRREPPSPVHLNRAATRIDRVGRRLHGAGWARDHEIGGCLTAAVRELGRAGELPEAERAPSVREAVHQLATALSFLPGTRPAGAGTPAGP